MTRTAGPSVSRPSLVTATCSPRPAIHWSLLLISQRDGPAARTGSETTAATAAIVMNTLDRYVIYCLRDDGGDGDGALPGGDGIGGEFPFTEHVLIEGGGDHP